MVDVEKLALLARIQLDSSEKSELQKDFEAILGYISELRKATTSGEEALAAKAAGLKNILREDVEAAKKDFSAEELVDAAPRKEGGYIKVKHVFE
ncbi:MAG: Asp-tRNA(Asn)/Glu-tRNA(Gln) amidotransferase subunit GatC [Candidatus Pacebacteria bacterium]|nr:Asp-tRNA(Asn)/Glu-tRNA(Gln) amidotransferase subunit GatC [Candidatus Paceibacterota bacterium]NUQ57160.1 Asp-tRNA(Asn)/Glu-tRNA(Gln) amidotransferase subunit GatC [Candidatus Paceibacter sp.]